MTREVNCMFFKVKDVKPIEGYNLIVVFENNTIKKYDIKPLFDKWSVFRDLKLNSLFNQVTVDCQGYGIKWNDEIDLSCNELWNNGMEIRTA